MQRVASCRLNFNSKISLLRPKKREIRKQECNPETRRRSSSHLITAANQVMTLIQISFKKNTLLLPWIEGGGEVLSTSKKSNNIFLDSLDVDIKRRKTTSPDLRTQLTSCGRHPSSRVVDVLTHLPARHILHNSGLLLQVFVPLFDKSMDYRNIIVVSV